MVPVTIIIFILVLMVLLLGGYTILIQKQLRSINRQLVRRMARDTRQPLTLELINPELDRLTENINRCLKAEESLRLESVREEKRFKELIANISHDLRTPLTAIKGYQQLLDNGCLTEEQNKKLKVAQKHADELGSLIENFFEYSYLINAEPQINPERINLTNLVTDCLAEAVNSFEERGLIVRLEEALPIIVTADRGMTVRIVQNLIRNCLAHSAGDVIVRLRQGAQKAVLSFENPLGDASEIDVNRIFDRFYTGDRARNKASTGLGLAIVKLLAGQMEGSAGAALNENRIIINVELPAAH